MIKEFVAGDRMYCDRKGIPGIFVTPTARLMVATNNPPAFMDRSEGTWRRMIFMPFGVTIPAEKQDHQLAQKLKTELSGIFNWARDGRRRLYAQGSFRKSALAEAARSEYRADCNPARQFLEDHCRLDSTVNTLVERVYGRYAHWAKANGYIPIGAPQFGREVKKHFPKVDQKRTKGQTRPRAYVGLAVDDGDEPSSYNVCVEEVAA